MKTRISDRNKARWTGYLLISSLVVCLSCAGAMAAGGDLDTSLGGDGKVATDIGAAYMVAAGLPVPRPDHAESCAALALEILDLINTGISAQFGRPAVACLQYQCRGGLGAVFRNQEG